MTFTALHCSRPFSKQVKLTWVKLPFLLPSSVFSCWGPWFHSVASNFLQPHGLQHNFFWHIRQKFVQPLPIQFSSVAQSCPTLCDPMNRSMPGLPVHHQLLEFTQIHIHRVGDAIQPSHPLSSPSPPAPNPFQHQSLFQ